MTGLSRTTLWRYERDGKFPASVQLGSRNAWYERDVHAWLENLPRGASGGNKQRATKAQAARRKLKPELRVYQTARFTVASRQFDKRIFALFPLYGPNSRQTTFSADYKASFEAGAAD